MTLTNILQIHIEEPTSNPDQTSIHHTLADDLPEAEKRYRILIRTLINQLIGLNDTHVRFIVSPADPDAIDAVSFWLLPLFRGNVTKNGELFHFTPEQNAPAFTIEFTTEAHSPSASYQKHATLSAHCPQCSSRWINAAMTQCSETHTIKGKDYLSITHQNHTPDTPVTYLPELPLIHTSYDWEEAIHSPVGPKLKKFYQEL